MKVKLKQIADITGTSLSTVSRVINDRGYVKDITRHKIEQALIETGYQKTRKTYASKKSFDNIVLILVESISNDVYVDYIEGIYKTLLPHKKYPYIFVNHRSLKNDIEQLEFACNNRFFGIMMLSVIETPEFVRVLHKINCPFVTINRYLRSFDADMVVMDNYKIGYLATNLLIKKGHKKIAYMSGPENSTTSQDRQRGYKDALQNSGLKMPSHGIYHGDLSYQSGCECAKYFLPHKDEFTAIFSVNDTMALGLIDTFYASNLVCPKDFSLICADNTLHVTTGKVKITSIGYDSKEIGKSAAELLLERAKDMNGTKKTISFSPQIIERSSILDISNQ